MVLPFDQLSAHWMALLPLLIILLIWELVWKGIALWKAGRDDQLVWFVCLLIFNTIGILPIVYLFFFQKKRVATTVRRAKKKKR